MDRTGPVAGEYTAHSRHGERAVSDPDRLAHFLTLGMTKAIHDYRMIAPGDRVAVGVSAGKDSLALVALLRRWQRYAPFPYTLRALHFPVTASGPAPVPEGLAAWLERLGVPLVVLASPAGMEWPLTCYRCAQLRRRVLLEGAYLQGCGKLALAHHADDLAATTLVNLIKHGRLDTMAPLRRYRQVTVIRPFAYTEEREIARYARAAALPVQPTDCPLAGGTDRARAKELLRLALGISRQARINLVRAALQARYPSVRG